MTNIKTHVKLFFYYFRFLFRSRLLLCRRRNFCYICVLLIAFSLFTCYLIIISYTKCSFLDAEMAVLKICDRYENREALGSLCADLCELNHLKPNKCLPNHLGKDVVFEATYFDDHIVMKSSKINLDEFDQIYYIDHDGNQVHPNIDIFLSMIINTIQVNLNIKLAKDNQTLELLTKLWTRNMKNFHDLPSPVQNTAMNNIWLLIQQTEYLLMKYYEDVSIFPKIVGTCGPLYAVEFIQPLESYFSFLYPSWKENFTKRAELALKILEFVEKAEKNFPLLHFCDVKVGHFGFDKYGTVKFLDIDMVFFEPSLIQNIVSTNNCSRNEDCTFIDCKGSCNVHTQRCQAKVLDTNFQRICIKIFTGKFVSSYFGLLGSPPAAIASELHSLLKQCSVVLDTSSSHYVASEIKLLLLNFVKLNT